MNSLIDVLHQQFPNIPFQSEFSLAQCTTVKIGGPAEVFCEIRHQSDLIALIQFCQQQHIPYTLLGWGANTLIADRGIRGLVIRFSSTEISIKQSTDQEFKAIHINDRWQADQETASQQETFDDLNYSEDDAEKVIVEVDSGVFLPYAINTLISTGITGLQWFARIPATIAGAIYNNIHGGRHFFSEFVKTVKVIDEKGNIVHLDAQRLEFDYDYSRFHKTSEVILSAQLVLYKGDQEKAKAVVALWSTQKKHQPQNSLGCVFQNISLEEQRRLGYPTPSVGYIVEHVLQKKGFRIGDAKISEKHAAFIENVGQATAADYLALIRTVIEETEAKTGLHIKPEIFFKGFSADELAFLTS